MATITSISADEMRRQIRRKSQLKGRQADESSLLAVQSLLGPGPYRRDLLIEYLHLLNDHHKGLLHGHLVALAKTLNLPMAEVFEVASFTTTLTSCQKAKRPTRREGEIACDEILFSHLRALRKRLADERGVPAYVVFGDTTLRQMAREYPVEIEAMDGITGVGAKKRAEYGATFAAAIAGFLAANPRVDFGSQ